MKKVEKVKQVSLVLLETKDPLVKEWVLKDKDGEVIRGDFGTEISFNDAVVTIKRLSPFFSPRFEHHYMLADVYEAPLIVREEERDHWIPTTFVRVQKLLYEPVKRCGPDTVAKFLKDKSKIEMILENEDGTFLFRKVDVRIRITPRDKKEIESIECGFDMDGERKWRSWLEVKYKEDPSKVKYDITSYQDHIRGRLLLGRGKFSTNNQKANNQKEVYRGVLGENEVVLKILNCRLKDDWQGGVQGITLDDLVIDDVGDSIVREIAIMQEIAESPLPNGEHPHLALGKDIYTTVSDTQRTGHLLVAFPYQSNSSLLSFLESKKYKSSGSEQKLKMIRIFTKDIAMGLHQLHELGYAHLDLTLENIVVTADYRCMLIDFGQARKINANMKVNLTELECKKQYYNPFHLRCFGGIEKDVILSGEMLKMIDIWNLGIIVMTLQGNINLGVPNWMKGKAPFRSPLLDANLSEYQRAILIWVANRERILKLKLEWERAKYEGLELAVALLEWRRAKFSAQPEDLERAETLLEWERAKLSNYSEDLETAETLLGSELVKLLNECESLERARDFVELARCSDKCQHLKLAVEVLKRAKCSGKYEGLKLAVTLLESKLAKCSDKRENWEMVVTLLKSECANNSNKRDMLELAVFQLECANLFYKYEDWKLAEILREWESAKRPDNYKYGLMVAMALLQWERVKRSSKYEDLELTETSEWECAKRADNHKDVFELAVSLLQWERGKCSVKCEGLELAMALLGLNLNLGIPTEDNVQENIEEKVEEDSEENSMKKLLGNMKLSEDVLNHPWLSSLNDEERPATFAQWTAAGSDEKSTRKRSRSTDVTSQESETSSKRN
eukprot:gene6830-7545_t